MGGAFAALKHTSWATSIRHGEEAEKLIKGSSLRIAR
jgi:hypothetical protein